MLFAFFYKEIINKNLGKWKDNYEIIYLFIFFIKKCKEPVNSINQTNAITNIQNITEKFLFEYPNLKKDKKLVVFFNEFISKKLIQVYPLLFDSIILFENKKYFQI